MVFIQPLFASGINAGANSAPCTDTTLETYSGNSNLSADWQANKIDVYWYDGNTKVSGGPTSCTYDGTLNIPPTPTKTGYTFAGWTALPHYDFSTLSTDVDATEFRGVARERRYCWHWTSPKTGTDSNHTCTSDYEYLNPYEWEVIFPWGTVYGIALCSTTAESVVGKIGTPDESGGGKYTWCKITGYKPTNSNTKYSPNNPVSWVFVSDSAVTNPDRNCTWHSVLDCARETTRNTSVRSAIFGK